MKTTRKFLAIIMVIAMIVSMGVLNAFAATSTLKINTTAGHTYKVYQLLKGDVSEDLNDGNGTLSNTTIGSSVKEDTDVAAVDAALKRTDGNYLTGEALGNAAYALIDTTKVVQSVVGDGSAKTVTVDNGYYIVVDSWTGAELDNDVLSRYMVAVVGDTEMTPKTTKPEIDKDIVDTGANAPIANTDNKVNTAAIGDVIDFEITSTVPNTEGYTYYYYVVHDTMSEGLTLDQNSFVVTVGSDELVKGTHYNVYDVTDTAFTLAFIDMKTLVADGTIAVGEAISIKYSAAINDNAAIGLDPNTNTAYLEYSNNPGESSRNDEEGEPGNPQPGTATGKCPEKVTKTYVTELTILKVDNTGKKLVGAQFTLTGENLNKVIVETNTTFRVAGEDETAEYYELVDGTFTKTAPNDATEGEDGYNADKYKSPNAPTHVRVTSIVASTDATGAPKAIVGEVNAEGYVTFTGLNAGSYTLSETVTPDGYNTMADINFTITATVDADGNFAWSTTSTDIVLDAANGVFDATIINYPGTQLPSTGGAGTALLIGAGSVLALAAAVFLVTKKRVKNAEF